jgi:hypothetical protein
MIRAMHIAPLTADAAPGYRALMLGRLDVHHQRLGRIGAQVQACRIQLEHRLAALHHRVQQARELAAARAQQRHQALQPGGELRLGRARRPHRVYSA